MSTRLDRILGIEEQIRKERYPSVDTLCRMFEVQPRTVYDDIRFLREHRGLDIQFSRFRGGYYNANPSKSLPTFELSTGEVFALTLGKEMLSEYTGTSFEPVLRSAIEKIVRRLPDRVHLDIDDIKCMVRFDPGAVIPISRKMFLDLNRACEKRLPVDINYYSASKDERTFRRIHPYRVLENRATWYVVGFCHLRQALRIFALHRIENYKLSGERFRPPEDLDIDAWLDKAFQLEHTGEEHRVRVRFEPRAARYIRERNWHPTQTLTEHEDGACTMEFVTQSLDEAKRWLLTYGSQATVMEPVELRNILKEEHLQAAAAYA